MSDCRCPKCGKRFKAKGSVTRHLGQPGSSCAELPDDLIVIPLPPRPQVLPLEGDQGSADMDFTYDFYPTESGNNIEMTPYDEGPSSESSDEAQRPRYREDFPGASKVYGTGESFMGNFDSDGFAEQRKKNLYYPFASKDDWSMAAFLLRSRMSMAMIDEFLKLGPIRPLPLSFRTAKDLRGRIEILPPGPMWRCKPWKTTHPTKGVVKLFYRDALDCVQSLFNSPLVADDFEFHPYRIFKTAEKSIREYSEWMSGDAAWEMQEKIPAGATLLGTVLSSDKTTISAMTGNRTAHPLLISLANIKAGYRAKSSHHAFLLLALLPVPKFITSDKVLRGTLGNRLLHECLSFVLEPLKVAARLGVMLSDPFGFRRFCFTPLAAYIVDTPEAAMLSGVGGKTSPVTMASHKQFGDPYRHEPRTASITFHRLCAIGAVAKPDVDIKAYLKLSKSFRLNGVHDLFWLDWPLAEPSLFLTPEPLHHWNKEFYDHDLKWCIRMLGEQEIDFRFSILQPHIGFRHFSEGVSRLKQVTGREHRNIQRYIVAIIAGAAPRDFVVAIRSLMDFRYLAQAPVIDDTVCDRIGAALAEFHDHKSAIMEAGVRVGKGNRPISNWYIPKLELMQSVVPNIKANGASINWTADHTEHAHIEVVKNPGKSGNNQKYEEQICRDLDRSDKCRRFDLATAIREARPEFGTLPVPSFVDDDVDPGNTDLDDEYDKPHYQNPTNSSSALLNSIHTVSRTNQAARVLTNYFEELVRDNTGKSNIPWPLRTFTAGSRAAIQLNREPLMRRTLITDIASMFDIPDLAPSLSHFLSCAAEGNGSVYTVGGRRRPTARSANLPFQMLEVWPGLRIQLKDYHNPSIVGPPQTLCARPPCQEWESGRFDAVLVNTDPDFKWPFSKISGHCVVQLKLIFCIVHLPGSVPPPESPTNSFLAYVQRFDIVPQARSQSSNSGRGSFPEASTGMYVLKRSIRADGSRTGDVIPLSHIRTGVDLVPRFMDTADSRLTKETSLEHSNEFLLNHFYDKQLYYSLLGA